MVRSLTAFVQRPPPAGARPRVVRGLASRATPTEPAEADRQRVGDQLARLSHHVMPVAPTTDASECGEAAQPLGAR